MPRVQALQIHAGARARRVLRERGLRAADVRIVPGAAGGPKGLVLNALDRFVFGDWLAAAPQTVHLPGASIGAWRLACACLPDPARELAQMADDYVHQHYEHAPGRPPLPAHVSAVFGAQLRLRFGGREHEVLQHPRRRLHVFASRGRHRLLRRQGRLRTPLGYLGALAANAAGRRALSGWLERVIFSDPRAPLPLALHDYRTHQVPLTAANLCPSILASCSIPFWLDAVHDIPGAPAGAYWDGGITDYHLRLDYGSLLPEDGCAGLVLYPHFQPTLVPGWLDKAWKRRHRADACLDNVVLLSPTPAWIATLPNAKLPDRSDFKAYGDDLAGRVAAWSRAVRESGRLADEFAALAHGGRPIDAQPLP